MESLKVDYLSCPLDSDFNNEEIPKIDIKLLPLPELEVRISKSICVNKGIKSPAEKKDLNLTILQRVRLRQEKREKEKSSKLSKAKLSRNAELSILPKTVTILHNVILNSKRSSLYLNEVTKKLIENMNCPISEIEALSQLNLLSTIASEWIEIIVNEFGTLIKINLKYPLTRVFQNINDAVESDK